MTKKTSRRFERAGRKMDAAFVTAADRVEKEIAEVVQYLNDKVVPKARAGSSEALRIAAEKLAKAADYLDQQKRG